MNLFKKKLNIDQSSLGIISDPRSKTDKKKDYRAEELLWEFVPPLWIEKSEYLWKKWSIFHQDRSSSCLAQAVAKALGIENFLEEKKFNAHSAKDIYLQRANYPSKGMWAQDALKIAHNIGACLEQQMPSQNLSEADMNASVKRTKSMEMIAKILRGGNYIFMVPNIDKFASIIGPEGKGVILGVSFGPKEWSRKVPQLLVDKPCYRHGVCAVDFLLYQGKKALLIEDSWGIETGFEGRRILTEDWFKAGRVNWGAYLTPLKNEGTLKKLQAIFKRNLYWGLRRDPDVKLLQECLAWLNMFPSGIIDYTGNYYGITLKAVKLFQETYRKEISEVVNYAIACTGFVGPGTRTVLNRIFK